MIKGAFFDIDGTLVGLKSHRMANEDKQSLLKLHDNGIKVFLATGRHIEIADNAVFPIDGIIHCNGTMAHMTVDGNQHTVKETTMFKKIFSYPFPRETSLAIARICRDNDLATIVFPEHGPFVNVYNERIELAKNLLSLPELPVKDIIRMAENYDIFAFSPYIREDSQYLFDSVKADLFMPRWHPEFVDITFTGSSKAVALQRVANHLGWSMDEVIAFGDGTNDAPMIAAAGIGVAMGNALPEAKAAADFITDDVDHCGVSKALRELGLI